MVTSARYCDLVLERERRLQRKNISASKISRTTKRSGPYSSRAAPIPRILPTSPTTGRRRSSFAYPSSNNPARSAQRAVVLGFRRKTQRCCQPGRETLLAMFSLLVISMLVGWFISGPDSESSRVLVTSTGMRSVIVVLYVAHYCFPGTNIYMVPIVYL